MKNTSPKVEELYRYDFTEECPDNNYYNTSEDRGITKTASKLLSRIVVMKRNIEFLKNRLKNEKNLLKMEKVLIYNSVAKQDRDITSTRLPNYSIHPSAPALPNQTATKFETLAEHPDDRLRFSPPPKQHLKDMEQKCEVELTKLQEYVEDIKELKMHWRCLTSGKYLHEFNDSEPFRSQTTIRKQNRLRERVPSEGFFNS